jgi:hypothetical protein
MLDLGSRWSLPVGDAFAFAGLQVRRLDGWRQALVTGDLAAAATALGIPVPAVGAYGTAGGDYYAISIGSDRLLAVSRAALASEGWHEAGYGFTEMTDGYVILEIRGDGLGLLCSRASNSALVEGSPSARFEFAGLFCLAYFYGAHDRLRVHVDRGYAAYLLTWIARSVDIAPTSLAV